MRLGTRAEYHALVDDVYRLPAYVKKYDANNQ